MEPQTFPVYQLAPATVCPLVALEMLTLATAIDFLVYVIASRSSVDCAKHIPNGSLSSQCRLILLHLHHARLLLIVAHRRLLRITTVTVQVHLPSPPSRKLRVPSQLLLFLLLSLLLHLILSLNVRLPSRVRETVHLRLQRILTKTHSE